MYYMRYSQLIFLQTFNGELLIREYIRDYAYYKNESYVHPYGFLGKATIGKS